MALGNWQESEKVSPLQDKASVEQSLSSIDSHVSVKEVKKNEERKGVCCYDRKRERGKRCSVGVNWAALRV